MSVTCLPEFLRFFRSYDSVAIPNGLVKTFQKVQKEQ